jgi:hypothetical protein
VNAFAVLWLVNYIVTLAKPYPGFNLVAAPQLVAFGMNQNRRDDVHKAIDRHQTLDQMKQTKILAPWQKFSGEFVNTDAFIETLYNSLTGQSGKFVKHN